MLKILHYFIQLFSNYSNYECEHLEVLFSVYDEYKGCVVIYMYIVHHVHVLLSNGAK